MEASQFRHFVKSWVNQDNRGYRLSWEQVWALNMQNLY